MVNPKTRGHGSSTPKACSLEFSYDSWLSITHVTNADSFLFHRSEREECDVAHINMLPGVMSWRLRQTSKSQLDQKSHLPNHTSYNCTRLSGSQNEGPPAKYTSGGRQRFLA